MGVRTLLEIQLRDLDELLDASTVMWGPEPIGTGGIPTITERKRISADLAQIANWIEDELQKPEVE